MARFFQIVLLAGLALAVSSQDGTNYNAGDSGRSETVGPDGEVRGQYQYTDPNGKLITVKYSAGKDGFKVEGDHLPKAPQVPQAQAPQPQHYQPQPQHYQPQPQQYQPQPQQYNNGGEDDGQYRPHLYDEGQYNEQHHQQYQPQPQPQQYQPQPQQYQPQPQPQQNSYFGNFGPQQQAQPQAFNPAPHPNSLGNGQYNPFQFGPQAQPQPQQYNGGHNNGNRPVKVSVSQQPGQGFTYNFES